METFLLRSAAPVRAVDHAAAQGKRAAIPEGKRARRSEGRWPRRIGAVNTIVIDRVAGRPEAARVEHRLRRHPRQHHREAGHHARGPGELPRGGDRRGRHRPHRRRGPGPLRRNRRRLQPHERTGRRPGRRIQRQERARSSPRRMEKLCDSCCQIYINTTSVGMHPNVDASPLGDAPPSSRPTRWCSTRSTTR